MGTEVEDQCTDVIHCDKTEIHKLTYGRREQESRKQNKLMSNCR